MLNFWVAWVLCVIVFIILVPRCPDRRPWQNVMCIILLLLIVLPLSVGIIKDVFYKPCPAPVVCPAPSAPVICPPCDEDILRMEIDMFLKKYPKYKKYFWRGKK